MAEPSRPNILWFCTDQQRYDTIHSLGNPHIRTPNIDRLVSEGVAFTRAYCQSPICTPSRASFLTGRYPSTVHGCMNGNERWDEAAPLVTALLADGGYDCGLAGKLHLTGTAGRREPRPRNDGYRVFHWSHHPMPDLDPEHHAYHRWLQDQGTDPAELYRHLDGFLSPGVPAKLHQTTWCSEMAIRFITEQRDRPWCLSVNPFDPHPPFDPPLEYLQRYDPETLPHPLFRDSDLERQRAFRRVAQQCVEAIDPRLPVSQSDDEAPGKGAAAAYRPPPRFYGRQVIAAYYAMIELIDDQFARLLDVLQNSDQLRDTLIVFTSDHGELLGDHGLLYKGCRFFEGLVHVPLIIAWPGQLKAGRVSEALVESVDIAPTLLEAAGLAVPYFMQGRSLWPLLLGRTELHRHKPHVVAEYNDALGSARRPIPSHATMVFDGRYKSVVYHDQNLGELFDLQDDPGEFDNLWDAPGTGELKLQRLQAHVNAVMATSSAGVARTHKY